MVGIFKGFINRRFVFFDETPIITQVRCQIIVNLGGPFLDCLLHINDSGQFGNIDFDRLCRVTCLTQRFSHDGGDGFTHVAHLAERQNRVSRFLHDFAMPVGDLPTARYRPHFGKIGTGENLDNAGHRLCR